MGLPTCSLNTNRRPSLLKQAWTPPLSPGGNDAAEPSSFQNLFQCCPREGCRQSPQRADVAGIKSLPLPGPPHLPCLSPLPVRGLLCLVCRWSNGASECGRPAHGLVARAPAGQKPLRSQAYGDSPELTAECGHALDFLVDTLAGGPVTPCPLSSLHPLHDFLTAPHCRLHSPYSRQDITGGHEPAGWLQRRS